MTSKDSGQSEDRELLERYRRASDTETSAPSDAVRAAILAEGRRVAAELAKNPSPPTFDTKRPAANDSRWKFTAFGTLGAAVLAALIIAPRYKETLPASKTATSTAAAPAAAPAENSANAPVVLHKMAPQDPAPAPKVQSARPSAPRDSLQDVTTAARQKREETAATADSSLAAPRAYAPQLEEKAQAAASAGAADRVAPRITNQIAGALQAAPSPARLKAAAEAGDVAQTVALIDKGTDVNARDGQGRTALMIAVARGRLEVVRLLLQRGADPNLADNLGRTALREALDQNLNDIAATLKDAGAR